MKKLAQHVFCLILVVSLSASGALAQTEEDLVDAGELTKLGQTGFQFLSVSLDPRSAALGNAVTAVDHGANALLYNPATMARSQQMVDVALGKNEWLTDIDYNYGSLAFRPADGLHGTFGVSVMAVEYGRLQGTVRADNESGYLKTETFSPTAFAAGIGYARSLTDRFSVGGQVKYARQSLGSVLLTRGDHESDVLPNETQLEKGVTAVDFGILYNTGFRGLDFAASVRNFAGEITYGERAFELPLSFQLGAAMDLVDLAQLNSDIHAFTLSLDAVHPRAYSEQMKVGAEYVFMNTIALRGGYIYPTDEQRINLGVGIQQSIRGIQLGLDYAYSDFQELGNIHRIALRLGSE